MESVSFTSPDGTRIGCQRGGTGSPLLLIHGVGADRDRWTSVRPALERRYTVYSLDRRGRGLSDDGPDYTIEREFEDIAAVIDGIGGPVDVLAHSFGGVCALEASLRATRLRRLAIYEAPLPSDAPLFSEALLARLERLLAAGERDALVAEFLLEVPRLPPEQVERLRTLPSWPGRVASAGTIARELRAHGSYRFHPERFAGLRVPLRLLLGTASPQFFADSVERIRAAVGGGEVVLLHGQAHAAMDTDTERFLATVCEFFA